jgi:hypothetical protein
LNIEIKIYYIISYYKILKVVLMKKLLLSASKIALTFSLLLHAAQAMEKENLDIEMDVETTKAPSKRKADTLENNSGMDFETLNQNNMREANTIEGNSVTKKVKTEDIRLTFPLENFFPILQNYFLPNELRVQIVHALGSEDRKTYSLVNRQCKDFIDFYTYSVKLERRPVHLDDNVYHALMFDNNSRDAHFNFLLKLPNLESLKINHGFVPDNCIKFLINLKHLFLQNDNGCSNFCYGNTNDGLSGLTNLEDLYNNWQITDGALKLFTNLRSLNLKHNSKITDDSLSVLTNLEELDLVANYKITNEGIKSLIKLRVLKLGANENIRDDGLSHFTNLEVLDIGNEAITINGIRFLTKLRTLSVYGNKQLKDDELKLFTNLTKLDLCYNKLITDNSLSVLTKLKTLDLSNNKKITDSTLTLLTNITDLNLYHNKRITDVGLRTLTNLEKLDIEKARHITISSIINLTKLRSLSFDIDKFNIISLITRIHSLNILKYDNNRIGYWPALQNLIGMIERLFGAAERQRDKIDRIELLTLKKVYEEKFLPHVLNSAEEEPDEKIISIYPVEDMDEIRNKRGAVDSDDAFDTLFRLFSKEGLDLINRLFAINSKDTKLISH